MTQAGGMLTMQWQGPGQTSRQVRLPIPACGAHEVLLRVLAIAAVSRTHFVSATDHRSSLLHRIRGRTDTIRCHAQATPETGSTSVRWRHPAAWRAAGRGLLAMLPGLHRYARASDQSEAATRAAIFIALTMANLALSCSNRTAEHMGAAGWEKSLFLLDCGCSYVVAHVGLGHANVAVLVCLCRPR